MYEDFGNPSSLHKLGVSSEKYIKKSRSQIAKVLSVNEKEIFFTSGGTESNNFAIQGVLPRHKKGRIITTAFEHPSVLTCVEQMGKRGFEPYYLKIDSMGRIDLKAFEAALNIETVLVSIMHINNEIGSIQPIEAISQMIQQFNRLNGTKILLHVDAVQSFGKIKFSPKKMGIDLMSFSGHKINGLKGIGGLYVRDGITLTSLLYGGGQERGIRPGTENICGIYSLGEAAEQAFQNVEENYKFAEMLKSEMIQSLKEKCDDIEINGLNDALTSPYILNVSFRGVKGEVLLHTLEMKGIFVSTGSACSSKKKSYSHVLQAMSLDDERMDGAIRISFSKLNTIEEVSTAADIISNEVRSLRKIIKRR